MDTPNKETQIAIKEAERLQNNPEAKKYEVEEALRILKESKNDTQRK